MKRGYVSIKPGSTKGLKKTAPMPLTGGKKAPKAITSALGIHPSTNVSPMMLGKLVGHPNPKVRMAVKKMLGGY